MLVKGGDEYKRYLMTGWGLYYRLLDVQTLLPMQYRE
jgi:hypothetical protein